MDDIKKLFDDLFSINGVGSKTEKKAFLFLRFSAITLTLASSYTTFQGFKQYTPILIAFLLTIGVQSLLYSSAWKIGASLKSNNLKFLQIAIFSLTMLVSVFFSYSSLLDVVYKKEFRLADELREKQNLVANTISSVKDSISRKIDLTETYDDFKAQLIVWNDNSSSEVARYFGDLTNSYDRASSKQKAIEYTLQKNQQDYLSNPDSLNTKFYTASKHNEEYNRENRLLPVLTKFERCRILQFKHDSIFKEITSNNRKITIANISDFQQKKKELFPLVLGNKYSPKDIELPENLKQQLIKISELNIFYDFVDKFKVEDFDSISVLKFQSLKLIDKLPNSFKIDFSKIKNNLLDLDKNTGSGQHQFVASVMLLKKQNILAVGAFIIAFLIDFLVLFCGILGALPTSYLTLKTYEEMESVLESSLENIFSMNGKDYDSAFKRKLHLIISNCEPAPRDIALNGYPSVLANDKIKQHKLAADIGILISTSQARTFDGYEDVYLRTRFILWASEKLKS